MPDKDLDCVVTGSCVVDLICRPVPLDQPIGAGVLHEADPVQLTAGGITANSGITLSRMGFDVAVHSFVGDDAWGPIVRRLFEDENVATEALKTHPTGATSTTAVAVDPTGERSFFHCVGAPKLLDAAAMREQMSLYARSRFVLLGYYSLMPNLESDLPQIFKEIRATGCKTALDAAGAGGTMQPLEHILPQLDVYVPSLAEAANQTGEADPRKIIDIYRDCGAPGIVSIKLGTDGWMVSEKAGDYLHVPIVTPPGDVIDTTGAGDASYAGFLAGLLRGRSVEESARLAVAAGACAVTALGGWAGARSYDAVAALSGV